MNVMALVNLVVEGCGLIFCIVGILCARLAYKVDPDRNRFPVRLFGCAGLALISNMLGIIFKGNLSPVGLVIIPIANFCEFFFSYTIAWHYSEWLMHCLGIKGRHLMRRINLAILIVSEALLVISQFTHMYYYIDEFNVYHRGEVWLISQLIAYAFYFLDIWLLIRYPGRLQKRQTVAFAAFIAMPALASAVQMMLYGIYVLLFSCSICAFIIFVMILSDQVSEYCKKADELAQQQIELNESRMKLAMSQIQPHFLYNTLNAIHYLCEADPKLAQKTVANFSTYLRGNLSALDKTGTIPIEQEMDHTRMFIDLQQLRFGDELNVEYHINSYNFRIPPLSIQVLVDNAITHGVCAKVGGGTVIIRTDEYEDRYEASISDDGVGFDTEHTCDDGKPHYGIKNVRTRVESMCNGKLEIESTPGEGTTARIIIFKDKEKSKKSQRQSLGGRL